MRRFAFFFAVACLAGCDTSYTGTVTFGLSNQSNQDIIVITVDPNFNATTWYQVQDAEDSVILTRNDAGFCECNGDGFCGGIAVPRGGTIGTTREGQSGQALTISAGSELTDEWSDGQAFLLDQNFGCVEIGNVEAGAELGVTYCWGTSLNNNSFPPMLNGRQCETVPFTLDDSPAPRFTVN